MKIRWKRPPADWLAAAICGPLLALVGIGLMVMGKLFAWRLFWLWGLMGLLPGVIQTALLLPVLGKAEPKDTGRLKKLLYKLRCGYIRLRPVLLVLLTLAAGVATWLLWQRPFAAAAKLGYHVPVIAAVVFVVCVTAEKWCQHTQSDTAAGAMLRGIASGFFMLRMASISIIAAAVLRLTGFWNADRIVAVVLAAVAVYEALILGFSFVVRLLRKDMETKPEVLCRLTGMGKDKNILSYLEENTGITMRSIDDLVSYIRSGAKPEAILQAQAYEIITARTIGTDLDTLLSTDREVFSETFREELGQRLKPYGTGLAVVDVVLESIHPPVNVADVYQELISAEIDAEYMLLNAQNTSYQHIKSAQKEKNQTVSNALVEKYEKIAQAEAAVTEFMAAAGADKAYRSEYRFLKYLNALTQSYAGTKLVIVGEGVDSSRLVIGAMPAPVPEKEPDYYEEEFEYEEEVGEIG